MGKQKAIKLINIHTNTTPLFLQIVVLIMEEYFSETDETETFNFPKAPINHSIIRINQTVTFSRDTKKHIRNTSVNNSRNTHIVQIINEKCDRLFYFSGNYLVRLLHTE